MKKTMRVIACVLLTVFALMTFAACNWEGGGMKLTEEQWNTAFDKAKNWQNYTLEFNLEMRKNYKLDKDGYTTESGDIYSSVKMHYSLDLTHADGPRSSSYSGSSGLNEDGEWVGNGYRSYTSVEKGKLFGYYEDEESRTFKYEKTLDQGTTANQEFTADIQKLDDLQHMVTFTSGGKEYKLNELYSVLKYSNMSSHAYEGKLGVELNPEETEGDNPFKTDSAWVWVYMYNAKYDEENGFYDYDNSLPDDFSKWDGEINVLVVFETEYLGETYMVEVSLRYRFEHYPLEVPSVLYRRVQEDGETYYPYYQNILGQEGPADND